MEGGEAEPSFSVPKVAKLQPHERCLIARVQAKMTRIDLAKALGCSKAWVTEMEHDRAPVTMLLKYWNLAAD